MTGIRARLAGLGERSAAAAGRLASGLGPVLARLPAKALLLARPRACALGGALLGLAADWYGVLAGLVIGAMLDEARAEWTARAAIASFLRDPEGAFPPEPLPGLAAAAALALGGAWPGALEGDGGLSAATAEEGVLFERLAAAALPPGRGPRRELERILDRATDGAAARADAELRRPALARALATRGSSQARILLADFAYALAADRSRSQGGAARLERRVELELRALLADCGLAAAELAQARERAFPGYRDPWTVLGLEPGSPQADVKRAYRRLSRRLHPDAAGGSEAAASAFRELKEAYEKLRG